MSEDIEEADIGLSSKKLLNNQALVGLIWPSAAACKCQAKCGCGKLYVFEELQVVYPENLLYETIGTVI